jgi:hypothetical protein
MSLQFYVFWLRSLVSRHSRERQFTMGLKKSLEIAKLKHALLVNKKTGNMLFDEDVQEAIHSQFDLLLGCLPVLITYSIRQQNSLLTHFFDQKQKYDGYLFDRLRHFSFSSIDSICDSSDDKTVQKISRLFHKYDLYDYTQTVNQVIDSTIAEIINNPSVQKTKPQHGYYITGFHLGYSILCDYNDEIRRIIYSSAKVKTDAQLYCDFASTAARHSLIYCQKFSQFTRLKLNRLTVRPNNYNHRFKELAELKIQHVIYTNAARNLANQTLLPYFQGVEDPIVVAMRQLREFYTISEFT